MWLTLHKKNGNEVLVNTRFVVYVHEVPTGTSLVYGTNGYVVVTESYDYVTRCILTAEENGT